MGRAKIAVTLDERTLPELARLVSDHRFPNRSQAIHEAVEQKLARPLRSRLAEECAELAPQFERRLAEDGIGCGARRVARMLRGEVRCADLDTVRGSEQARTRPVLVLSADGFNERSGTVIAVAVTSRPQRAGFPLTLELSFGVLADASWVKISQIRTRSVERVGGALGRVASEDLARVIEGLNEILGS